jgi:hypothetical protein
VRQRFTSRQAELDAALGALGVERRDDSRLCEDFRRGKSARSADDVAEVMARMKYYHEYCPDFMRELEEAEEAVEAEVERAAKENQRRGRHDVFNDCDDRGYYRGIHMECMRDVLGTSSWAEFKDGLMERYSAPSHWPWLP